MEKTNAILLSLCCLSGGCGAPADVFWPARRALGAGIMVPRPPVDPSKAYRKSKLQEPAGPLSLRLALALARNPELRVHAREVRIKEAEMLQAGLVPNPELSADAEDFLGSSDFKGVGQLQVTVQLSQVVELGGKRAARLKVARMTGKVAGWEYELKRMETLTEVTKAFVDVVTAQKAVRYLGLQVQLAQKVVEVFQKQPIPAGAPTALVERAKVAKSLAVIRLDKWRRQLDASRRALAVLWGSLKPRFTRAAGRMTPSSRLPTLSEMLKRINKNPRIALWLDAIAQRKAEVRLEKAQAVPNLTLRAGYRYINSGRDSAVVFGFPFPFPCSTGTREKSWRPGIEWRKPAINFGPPG